MSPHLDWKQRLEALRDRPPDDREDWYYRRLLAERHAQGR
jgi:hypothetical protein